MLIWSRSCWWKHCNLRIYKWRYGEYVQLDGTREVIINSMIRPYLFTFFYRGGSGNTHITGSICNVCHVCIVMMLLLYLMLNPHASVPMLRKIPSQSSEVWHLEAARLAMKSQCLRLGLNVTQALGSQAASSIQSESDSVSNSESVC